MQANYRYVVDKLLSLAPRQGEAVLDYGCGKGDIVRLLRDAGLEAFGVEKFYAGSDIREAVEATGLAGDIIRELESDGRIPFADASFDFVVSNQVFEHIEDLQPVVDEIARVLKPGGKLLCLFPTLGTLREVHCGVPIAHWFPKRSRLAYYWLLMFRKLGFGYHKAGKPARQWAGDFLVWLADFTHYRTRRQTSRLLGTRLADIQATEDGDIAFRLNMAGRGRLAGFARHPLFRGISRTFCRLYGGVVLIATKP